MQKSHLSIAALASVALTTLFAIGSDSNAQEQRAQEQRPTAQRPWTRRSTLSARSPHNPSPQSRSSQSRSSPNHSPQMQPTDSVLLPGIYWENDRQPLKLGQVAPNFSLSLARDCRWREANKKTPQKQIEYSNDGQTPLVLGDFVQSGKGVTIVVFWAFWCDTWKDVSRFLVRMKPKLQSEHTQILCVAVDASQQPVARRAFADGTLWYPVVIDPASATTANWGVRRVPTLFVLDNLRRVRRVFEGFPGELPLLRAIHEARKTLVVALTTSKVVVKR